MDLKPLICPQCGGEIDNYLAEQTTARCGYCGTRFVIEDVRKAAAPVYPTIEFPAVNAKLPAIIALVAIFFGGGILLAALFSGIKGKTSSSYAPATQPTLKTPYGTAASPTPVQDLLRFGGTGDGSGLFKDASAIGVDSQGRIYIGDRTLRVQQFNDKGEFIRAWQIPKKTSVYDNAQTIGKIRLRDDGKLYVDVSGAVLEYSQDSVGPVKIIHVAPAFIQDFVIRSDGSMMLLSNDEDVETLSYRSKSGAITKRLRGFHTNAADAAISPAAVGFDAIRFAVDKAGNIFSIYAFGALGSYQASYDVEELMIYRFDPQGKYVNKFVQSMNSTGIEVDDQNRIYVSDHGIINVYNNSGDPLGFIDGLSGLDGFALDKQNNIYVIASDQVVKRPAVR